MSEQLGMIGTFLASRRQQSTKMSGTLDFVETRVEERFEPVRTDVAEFAAPAQTAPSPPSWDPLGVAPHLWDQLPDLPDTTTAEIEKSTLAVTGLRRDAAYHAARSVLDMNAAVFLLVTAVATWALPAPLKYVSATVVVGFVLVAVLVVLIAFCFPRAHRCSECAAPVSVFRVRPAVCERCRVRALAARMRTAVDRRSCCAVCECSIGSGLLCPACRRVDARLVGRNRTAAVADPPSMIPPDLCDDCYACNIFASPGDIVLCSVCRRRFPLPSWAWEFETASTRDRLIRQMAIRSIAADRKTGRPVRCGVIESSKLVAGAIDAVKFAP